MEAIYKRVKSGEETRRVLSSTGRDDYRERLGKELKVIADSEMWRAGEATRSLRPREAAKAITKATKGIGGRKGNWSISQFLNDTTRGRSCRGFFYRFAAMFICFDTIGSGFKFKYFRQYPIIIWYTI